ncbi:hypothetical protein A7A76_07645 [Lysobacter enzymogenes]|uniref:hypothetical protein n=1 Tax=Lysobacter enzymogenes TaxID=69 RepID=UPI0019D1789C|nr:hypothetical protein [Lysobacter enzymogenes]MBN7138966.1 hypothetical protein [Lysobacter enzymogenes]
MSNVIPLHAHRIAKGSGVFAAVAIAATRMGFTPEDAERFAASARAAVLRTSCSPAAAVSQAKAKLRAQSQEQLA